jgi:hypothetical protein
MIKVQGWWLIQHKNRFEWFVFVLDGKVADISRVFKKSHIKKIIETIKT